MAVKTEKDLPENLRATWLKALSAMQLKNFGYTIQLLQGVLKAVPDFLPGRQLARKAAIARAGSKKSFMSGLSSASFSAIKVQSLLKKDPAAAMEAVEKILENEPYNQQANFLLRDAAMALKMHETATFALQTAVDGNPKEPKLMHELAKHLMSIDQPMQAGDVYSKILEIAPHDIVAMKGSKDASARASIIKGGWEKEETTYRDLIKDKEEAILLEQKSRVVRSDEMIDQQIAELHKQVETEPENIDASRRIAELYEQKEDYGNAIQWFDYAAQLSGGADLALIRKSGDLRLKQFDLAIKEWEDYIASNPGETEVENAKAQLEALRSQRGQIQLDDAKRRVERNPTDLMFRYELGEIYLANGMAQEAIPELQKARANPNVRNRAMSALGRCYEAKGLLDLAAKTLSDAAAEMLAMDSTKKDILYNLAVIYEKMGDKDKSMACLKQIYEVDYNYRDGEVARRVEGSY